MAIDFSDPKVREAIQEFATAGSVSIAKAREAIQSAADTVKAAAKALEAAGLIDQEKARMGAMSRSTVQAKPIGQRRRQYRGQKRPRA